jgi:tripartite-type tricarboxylate transporter receptor subunit TctC
VYAAWSIELPPNAPKEIVDWYVKAFGEAVRSEEYKEWRRLNIVFYEEGELTPAGLKKHMEELRTTFLPVLNKLDLSKE